VPTFAKEFDDKFQNARQRVLPQRDHEKRNGKTPRNYGADNNEFVTPGAIVGVSLDDFYAYMPMHAYIFAPSGELWPASSVDSRFPHQPLVNPDGSPLRAAENRPARRPRLVVHVSPRSSVCGGSPIERPGAQLSHRSSPGCRPAQ
jgi:hypothetical protein